LGKSAGGIIDSQPATAGKNKTGKRTGNWNNDEQVDTRTRIRRNPGKNAGNEVMRMKGQVII